MADWTFQQLSGDKKVLKLSGWSAPFGRARKEPVVTPTLSVRMSEVYYPGNDVPTRHRFGIKYEDWELHGRWMDSEGGKDYAQNMRRYVEQFVDDQQQLKISWGDIVSVYGMLGKLEPEIESKSHIAWKLTVKIDKNLLAAVKRSAQPKLKKPKDFQKEVVDSIQDMFGSKREGTHVTQFPPSLDIGIIENLDLLVGTLNKPLAMYVNLMTQLESLEQASISSLRRAKAGMHQLKTLLTDDAELYGDYETDEVVQSTAAVESLSFWDRQQDFGLHAIEASRAMQEAERAFTIAERGKIKSMYSARTGDTWEGMAKQTLGSCDRATDIRDANGVTTGAPVAGTVYVIPV